MPSARACRPEERGSLRLAEHASYTRRQAGGEDVVEIATFYIGGNWYGVKSSQMVEAIDAGNITVIPGMPEWARGCIMHEDQPITIFDRASLLTSGRSLTESLVKPHPADPDKRVLVILSVERVLQRLSGVRPQSEAPLSLTCCEA